MSAEGVRKDGVAYLGISNSGETISADTYSFTVSAPKDGGSTVSDTFTLTVTDDNTPPSEVKTLTGLRITKQPTKTTYTEGETFDPTGMEVTAEYNNQTSAVIHGYTYSPNTALTRDDKFVTIHYAENGVNQTAEVPITVNSKELTPATITSAPTAKSNLVYNGTEQELINAGIATGGTLQYKLGDGSYSTDLPKAKDAKTYTVYYKAVGENPYCDSEEKSLNVTINRQAYGDKTASGSAKYGAEGTVDLSGLIVPGGKPGAALEDPVLNGSPIIEGGKTLKFAFVDNKENVGKSVMVKVLVVSPNYEDYTITVTLTVSGKNVPTLTAPTANKLIYNGKEQALITAGQTSGGELQYSLSSSKGYSATIPVGKAAGNYTVYYKVVGDENIADVAENSIKVSIAKKDVTVAPKSVTIRRGNTIPTFELVYSGLVSGETLKPSVEPKFACNDNDGNPVSTSTAAGTYTITWTNVDDTTFSGADNYNVVKSATGTLTIRRSSSGGSSSSSSSQTTKPTTNKTETTKNTDGSTTKTETTADGTLIKTTTEVNGTTTVIETKKDGTVTKKITNSDGSTVTTKSEPNGSMTTERRDENGSVGTETKDAYGKTEIRTTLSENAVSNAKENASPVAAPISVQAEKNSISAPQIHITLPQDAEKTKVEISVSNVNSGTAC